MKPKNIYFIWIVLLFIANTSFAQIFSQGKNINNSKVYAIQVELEPKHLDPDNYHAHIHFHGQGNDVKWYLKEGVEHKTFANKDDLISYLEKNGWIFLQTEIIGSSRNQNVCERYLFRKSMEQLSKEFEQQSQLKRVAKNSLDRNNK